MLTTVGKMLLIVVVALAASADTTMQMESVVGRPQLARNNDCGNYRRNDESSNDHIVVQRHSIMPWIIWNIIQSPTLNQALAVGPSKLGSGNIKSAYSRN